MGTKEGNFLSFSYFLTVNSQSNRE